MNLPSPSSSICRRHSCASSKKPRRRVARVCSGTQLSFYVVTVACLLDPQPMGGIELYHQQARPCSANARPWPQLSWMERVASGDRTEEPTVAVIV